jgi:hypothetical protein
MSIDDIQQQLEDIVSIYHKQAKKYYKRGLPLLLVIDHVDKLIAKDPEAFKFLQQWAKSEEKQGHLRFVFISSDMTEFFKRKHSESIIGPDYQLISIGELMKSQVNIYLEEKLPFRSQGSQSVYSVTSSIYEDISWGYWSLINKVIDKVSNGMSLEGSVSVQDKAITKDVVDIKQEQLQEAQAKFKEAGLLDSETELYGRGRAVVNSLLQPGFVRYDKEAMEELIRRKIIRYDPVTDKFNFYSPSTEQYASSLLKN